MYRLQLHVRPTGQHRKGQCYVQVPKDPFAWPPPIQIGLSPIPSVDCFGWHHRANTLGLETLSLADDHNSCLFSYYHHGRDGFEMAGCEVGATKLKLFRLLEEPPHLLQPAVRSDAVRVVYSIKALAFPVESGDMALSILSSQPEWVAGALLVEGWLLVKVTTEAASVAWRRQVPWLCVSQLVIQVDGLSVGEPLDPSVLTTPFVEPCVLLELPHCPACLDRMDYQATGLTGRLTETKWRDCIVCQRLVQPGHCAICHSSQQVWLCLICGQGGCGRYQARHAHAHHQQTGHNWAIEQSSHRVWDYLGDRHVHRMIKDPSSQIHELPQPEDNTVKESKKEAEDHEWCEARIAALERQSAIRETQWLNEQRGFEAKQAEMMQDWMAEREDWGVEAAQLQDRIARITAERDKLHSDVLRLTTELAMEHSLTQQMTINQEVYREMLGRREETIKDLEEQVRDLMGHLQASQLLAQLGGGDIIIQESKKTRRRSKQ